MQAVRADRRRSPDTRWIAHLSLLSAVGLLFSWLVTARPHPSDLVAGLPTTFLAPPSSPAQEWRPVRVPVRTSGPRDPSAPSAAAFLSHERGNPEVAAGLISPAFVTSVRDTPLWSGDAEDAPALAVAPTLAMLQVAGLERNGRVAVRIDDRGADEAAIAWVERESVVESLAPAERALPLVDAFSPRASATRLEVPHRTQLDGSLSSASNCGPASVGMALEAFGIYVPTPQIRALANRFMGIYDPWGGTTLESLRGVAEHYGLVGLDLHETGRYKRWTVEDVRRHIRAGHPVIPQLRYRLMPGREWVWVGYDHYVVITGVLGDDFIMNDPINVDGRGERVISAQALLRAWMNSDFPGAAVAIARPV
jgi:hypothetical protein